MNNLFLAGTFVSLICTVSAPQDSTGTSATFKMADYKPKYFFTQSLSLTPSFSFGGNNSTETSPYSPEQKSQGVGGSFKTQLNHSLRNHKESSDLDLATELRAQGYPSQSTRKSQEENEIDNKYKNSNFRYYLKINSRYRHYLKSPFFAEVTIAPGIDHTPLDYNFYENSDITKWNENTKHYQYNKLTVRNRSFKGYGGLQASIGYGWVADVTGANVASYIIDRIAVMNNGKRPVLSNDQMRELSLLVDKLRKKRILDQSLESIETIDTLCKYLINENIIEKESARLGMELDYAWSYGFNHPILSGKEFKITPFVKFVYTKNGSDRENRYYDTTMELQNIAAKDLSKANFPFIDTSTHSSAFSFGNNYGVIVNASYIKPFNRYLGINASLEGVGSMLSFKDSSADERKPEYVFERSYPNAIVKSTIELVWYPSLRSALTWTNSLLISRDFSFSSHEIYDANNIFGVDTSSKPSNLQFTEIKSNVYLSHFISKKLSVNVYSGVSYTRGRNRSSTYLTMANVNPYFYYYSNFSTYYRNRISYDISANFTYSIY